MGTPLERQNIYCDGGFADIHLDFLMNDLDGTLDTAQNNPETNTSVIMCNKFSNLISRAKVVNFKSDFFTDEEFLLDAVSDIGPTSTNIAVTPHIHLWGGGVYYNETQCVSYAYEKVPDACVVERNGRWSYTCLKQNNVDCAKLLPDHCNIFFDQPEATGAYPHLLTAVGYGEDEAGTQFWKFKNSWGTDWGENGFLRLAKGYGHCGVGSLYAVPECKLY